MPDLRIAQADAQALLNYLQRLPYGEVAGFVAMLVALKPVEAPKAAADAGG